MGIEPPKFTTDEPVKKVFVPVLSSERIEKIVSSSAFADKIDMADVKKAIDGDNQTPTDDVGPIPEIGTRPPIDLFKSIFGDESEIIDNSISDLPSLTETKPVKMYQAALITDEILPKPVFIPRKKPMNLSVKVIDEPVIINSNGSTSESKGDTEGDKSASISPVVNKVKKRPAAADLW